MMKALFAQQRAQIIYMHATKPELISASYAHAWTVGMYPVSHDGDSSVPDMPHENFEKYFITKREFVDEVTSYLDDLWMKHESPGFYDLEAKFGGKSNRSKLLNICRYHYLQGLFDDVLWDALRANSPSEGSGIVRDYEPYL